MLKDDTVKQIVINSLKVLSDRNLITVYAFVIMPSHIHLIWRLDAKNGVWQRMIFPIFIHQLDSINQVLMSLAF